MSPLGFGGHDVADLGVEYEINPDAQTGAAIFRVPVPAPPGRGGLSPAYALTYSSQAGNSPFGAGWSLSGLLTIGIDTRKQVPQWDSRDGYQLGQESLVPWLERGAAAAWQPRGFETREYAVTFYRSRTGGSTLRVEKWLEKLTGRVHFRTRDARNVLTIYGARPRSAARIADPSNETRTYLWLPELQIDPHGNAVWLEYEADTLDGVDRTLPFERGRAAPAQRYLKRVLYGNSSPLALTPEVLAGRRPTGLRWYFQLVFDYGDHGASERPRLTPDRVWPVRRDPFSSCRAGFEIRTYRLCRRILSFHDFPELEGPTPIGALTLVHDEDPAGATVRQIGYVGYRNDGPARALPPLRLTYSPAATSGSFEPAPSETQENVPAGLSLRRYAFVDLLGEGLPGILTEGERSWYYKPNLGNGRFGAQTVVLDRPAVRPGTYSYGDYDHDGDTDLAQMAGRLAGFFELDRQEAKWQEFRPFSRLPHVEAMGRRAQWVDLNGDGMPDIVMAQADRLVWFPSQGNSFADPVEIARPSGSGAAPLVAEDPALDFFFADMNGDGLVDLVRIQNGRVEYWPNLGGGRFGDGILLDGSPRFAPDGEFDAGLLRFVDLDGSGTTDLVYLGRGEVTCWINASGNQLIPGLRLRGLPFMDQVSTVRVLDFLGDGRPCLVWSSPLPGRESPLQHLPLAPVTRPRLLVSVEDSLGQETRLAYSSSAAHYLRDQQAGRPWSSRLPTHVTVVDRHEVLDHIGGTKSVSRYEYREGHFDGGEREFRGFGQVDVYDAEAVTDAAPGAAVTAPTVTRTWFHLGTAMWSEHRPVGTYTGDPDLPRIAFHTIESDVPLTEDQEEDALRALAGRVLRREVYAVDERGRRAAHPFAVSQVGYRVRLAQPTTRSARAAWSVILAEELVAAYEHEPRDPRLAHRVTLETDAYGQVVREAEAAYARRAGRPRDVTAQGQTSVLVHDYGLVNIDTPNRFELGVPVEGKDYELLGVVAHANELITRERLRASDIAGVLNAPRPHHEAVDGFGARLLSWEQSFYWNDDRTAALSYGSVGALTLIHHEESACFTPGFAEDIYARRSSPSRLAGLGYILRDGYHWKRDEVHHFAPRGEFSQRVAFEARDGGRTTFTYDRHALEIVAIEDALGNRTTADIDYHVLAPWRLTDPNGAVREVRYDALGVITLETSRGAVGGNPWGFDALPVTATRIPTSISDLLSDPGRYLQGVARFIIYDLEAWQRDRTPTTVVTLLREELLNDGRGGSDLNGRIQVQVSYLDGLGRTLQAKTLVEPGAAIQRRPDGGVVVDENARPVLAPSRERWLASGHIVYDAKQRPSRVYEPFFTTTWRFESDEVLRRFGVSSLTVYDALGRVVMEHLPNGTFTRATYGAWEITREDANDTVLESAYRRRREGLAIDDPERQALEHARAHAGTATTTFLDPQGREVGSLTRGGSGDDRRTEMRLDGAGELREVVDARGLVAFRYRRDMEGRLLFTQSMDAGDSWTLPDADDWPVFIWDELGVEVENIYDRLGRVTAKHVRGRGLDHRVEERVYGETVAGAAARNLLGRLVTVRDQAGETSVERYYPTGQALRTTQRLRTEVGEPDWRSPVALDAESFVTEVSYDALGRPRREVLADRTVRVIDYLRGGGVDRVRITTPDGRLRDEPVVNGAEFDAHGQRLRVRLGNGVEVTYGYDAETARLKTQTARLGSRRFQDIRYSYDPVGNVIRIEDLAHDPGRSSLIAGTLIAARRDYSYDAHYRLARATGRVHQALLEHDYIPGVGTLKGTRHLSLNNGAALERFAQTYAYDAANNIRQIRHLGASRSWTTEMWISATSNRSLPRLDAGGVAVPDPESHFDADGNVARMSHLRRLDWNWRGTLARAVIIERPGGTDDAEEYTYGSDGMRVRKVTTRVVGGGQIEVNEKVYFGSCERKRLLRAGAVLLERWTTHISDGQGRVALVHRWVTDTRRRETDDTSRPRIIYQLTTHQNSGAIEIDHEGNLVSYEEYFPYGGTAFIAGNRARDIDLKEYRYTGKERDDATSLYYFGHRYYATWTYRWLSPDPIGPADDLNLYQFVLGNPVTLVDPDGLQSTGATTAGANIAYVDFIDLPSSLRTPETRIRGATYVRDPSRERPITGSLDEVLNRGVELRQTVFIYDPRREPLMGGGVPTPSNVFQGMSQGGTETNAAARPPGNAAEVFTERTAEGGTAAQQPRGGQGRSGGAHTGQGHGGRREAVEGPTGGAPDGAQGGTARSSRDPNSSLVDNPGGAGPVPEGAAAGPGRGRQGAGQGRHGSSGSDAAPGRGRAAGRGAEGGAPGGSREGQPQGTGTSHTEGGGAPPATPPQAGDPLNTGGAPGGVSARSPGTTPPPPNQIPTGRDPNGSLMGSERGHGAGTPYGTPTGTERNHQPAGRSHALTGVSGGSPQGNAGAGFERLGARSDNPTPSDALDYLTSLASASQFEFGDDSRRGQGTHGIPGGRGRLTGRVWQILYVTLIFFGAWIQARLARLLHFGFRLATRAASLARGGFALARGLLRRIPAGANVAARGQPFAFGGLSRSARASRMVNEGARALGRRNSRRLVDRVLYDPHAGSPYFWVDPTTGERMIVISAETFGKTRVGQLIAATHELVHAEQWAAQLARAGGDLARAHRAFFVLNRTLRYARREFLTEARALERVSSYLGGITPQQAADSLSYMAYWARRIRARGGRVPAL
jgi:RHS repeat-associated protein